jgi:xanthine phosphoribosyltransferase
VQPLDLDWDDIGRQVSALASALRSGNIHPDRLIAVARGGLVPAALLAAALSIAHVESIQVQLYEGQERSEHPRILGARPGPAGSSGDPARTLLVDEILDSGTTLRALSTLYPAAARAVLVARSSSREAAALVLDGPLSQQVWVGEYVDSEAWVLFPWSPPEDRPAR